LTSTKIPLDSEPDKNGRDISRPYSATLGTIVGKYKAAVTRQINKTTTKRMVLWQGRYHDHIIRNERELNYIREYVLYNPARWDKDTFYS
jgi:putative transposase